MQTIEPDIQEAILTMLPDDYKTSVRLMCQLLANIMLSGDGMSLDYVISEIKVNVAAYEGT